MELIKFPSIEQFRNVIKTVRDRADYHQVAVPTLKFSGSVKLHGTNASVVRDPWTGEVWCQSREQIITPEKDNAGFASFVETRKDSFTILMNIAAGVYGFTKLQPGNKIAIYGEWCGQGIQKGVAINQLSKRFVIFGIRIVQDDHSIWFTPNQLIDVADGYGKETSEEDQIFFIQKFQTWEVEIDFAAPEKIHNDLVALTDQVEACCPVGKAFGVEGVGEGIVWRCTSPWVYKGVTSIEHDSPLDTPIRNVETSTLIYTDDLIFKVKGKKHSDTKTKVLAPIDVEKINDLKELAHNVTTDHRLEKMLDKLIQQGEPFQPESIPVFLKLVGNDVETEEADTIAASGFTSKEVMKAVNQVAKQWYLDKVRSNF